MNELEQVAEKLKNLTEVEQLNLILQQVCKDNERLREELGYKKQNEYVEYWNKIKDIPLI